MGLFDNMPPTMRRVLDLAPLPHDYTLAMAQMIQQGYSVERAIMWVLERYRSALNQEDGKS
jgi:hypothetical protein